MSNINGNGKSMTDLLRGNTGVVILALVAIIGVLTDTVREIIVPPKPQTVQFNFEPYLREIRELKTDIRERNDKIDAVLLRHEIEINGIRTEMDLHIPLTREQMMDLQNRLRELETRP